MKRKLALGPWFAPVFRALRASRRLRGTPFDPFGRAEVRKVERQLIEDYLTLVDRLLDGLTPDNLMLAVEVAELPDVVRGYEDVKLRSVDRYLNELAAAVSRFDSTTTQTHSTTTH
jgi:indolepyruvate ferredoxin oxidoreductase